MTKVSIIVLCIMAEGLGVCWGQGSGAVVPPEEGLGCVLEMPVPLYEPLEWMVNAAGTFRVLVLVGQDSARTVFDVQGEASILRETLKLALRDAKFSPKCIGKKVEINFVYHLEGPSNETLYNRVTLKGGNTFEIVARPHPPIPPQAAVSSSSNGR